MKHFRWFWILSLVFLSCGKSPDATKVLDFRANDLNGKTVHFSEYRGKVVLLNVWATWCPPCVKEIPDLNEIYHEYKDKGVVVLGLSLDVSAEDVREALNRGLKIDYPVWHGDQEFARQYQIRGIPHTMIVSKEGTVVEQMTGMQSKETFEAAIRKLLM